MAAREWTTEQTHSPHGRFDFGTGRHRARGRSNLQSLQRGGDEPGAGWAGTPQEPAEDPNMSEAAFSEASRIFEVQPGIGRLELAIGKLAAAGVELPRIRGWAWSTAKLYGIQE